LLLFKGASPRDVTLGEKRAYDPDAGKIKGGAMADAGRAIVKGKITFFWPSHVSDGASCTARSNGGSIVVAYDYGGVAYRWTGIEEGDGHYRLACPEHRGTASLHCFPEETSDYSGSLTYTEGTTRWSGMWEVSLEEEL
jgi:hypothetical protein